MMSSQLEFSGTNGTYRIEEKIGEGAFGETFRAEHSDRDEPVVVKRLRVEHLEDWKALELFEREAKVLRGLDHPGIPTYIDYFSRREGDTLEGLYLVQEFVEGTSLQQYVRTARTLSAQQMRSWLRDLLKVCSYLHSRQPPVIHRDITPKNILLRDGSEPAALVDFGSVQAELEREATVGSTSAGTYGYAPPEQFIGRASSASDLYGLGVTFLAVAAGEPPSELPYENGRFQVQRVLTPHAFDDALVRAIEEVTRPTADERPQSADEVLELIGSESAGSEADEAGAELETALTAAKTPSSIDLGLSSEPDDEYSLPDVDPTGAKRLSSLSSKLAVLVGLILVLTGVAVGLAYPVWLANSGDDSAQTNSDPEASLVGGKSTENEGTQRVAPENRAIRGRPITDFNVTDFQADADRKAQEKHDGGLYFGLEADSVAPDGDVNLLEENPDGTANEILYWYASPYDWETRLRLLQTERMAKLGGLEHEVSDEDSDPIDCRYPVRVTLHGVEVGYVEHSCGRFRGHKPIHCSVQEIWDRAASRGVPTEDRTADIKLARMTPIPRWKFDAGDQYELEIPDACGERHDNSVDLRKPEFQSFRPVPATRNLKRIARAYLPSTYAPALKSIESSGIDSVPADISSENSAAHVRYTFRTLQPMSEFFHESGPVPEVLQESRWCPKITITVTQGMVESTYKHRVPCGTGGSVTAPSCTFSEVLSEFDSGPGSGKPTRFRLRYSSDGGEQARWSLGEGETRIVRPDDCE